MSDDKAIDTGEVIVGQVRSASHVQFELGSLSGPAGLKRNGATGELCYAGKMLPARGSGGTVDGEPFAIESAVRSTLNKMNIVAVIRFLSADAHTTVQ